MPRRREDILMQTWAHRPHSRDPQRHGLCLFGNSSVSHEDLRQAGLPLCPRSGRSTRPVLPVGAHERRKARQSHGLARASRTLRLAIANIARRESWCERGRRKPSISLMLKRRREQRCQLDRVGRDVSSEISNW